LWNLQCGARTGTGRKYSALFFPFFFFLPFLPFSWGLISPRGVDDDDVVVVVTSPGNYGGERVPKKKSVALV
jgi:hypothetical protein